MPASGTVSEPPSPFSRQDNRGDRIRDGPGHGFASLADERYRSAIAAGIRHTPCRLKGAEPNELHVVRTHPPGPGPATAPRPFVTGRGAGADQARGDQTGADAGRAE